MNWKHLKSRFQTQLLFGFFPGVKNVFEAYIEKDEKAYFETAYKDIWGIRFMEGKGRRKKFFDREVILLTNDA